MLKPKAPKYITYTIENETPSWELMSTVFNTLYQTGVILSDIPKNRSGATTFKIHQNDVHAFIDVLHRIPGSMAKQWALFFRSHKYYALGMPAESDVAHRLAQWLPVIHRAIEAQPELQKQLTRVTAAGFRMSLEKYIPSHISRSAIIDWEQLHTDMFAKYVSSKDTQ